MTKMWQMTNYVYKCNKNRPLVKTEKKQNILNNDMFNEDVEIVYYEGDTEDVKTLGSVIIYTRQGNAQITPSSTYFLVVFPDQPYQKIFVSITSVKIKYYSNA